MAYGGWRKKYATMCMMYYYLVDSNQRLWSLTPLSTICQLYRGDDSNPDINIQFKCSYDRMTDYKHNTDLFIDNQLPPSPIFVTVPFQYQDSQCHMSWFFVLTDLKWEVGAWFVFYWSISHKNR
jgi:hypothetical protein